ncbi:hypothetical protein [Enterococcus hailinensis]|uniref:hypothetical protein n=1 Tax=Enterococcus hailinensis TaxID=3238988 RepID=UPI0038B401B3
MLTSKEKVQLDKYLVSSPDDSEKTMKNGFRDTELKKKVECNQDDSESPIWNTDTIWHLKIETETKTKEFYLLFENAQETLDLFEEEIKRAELVRYKNGKDFKEEMEERYGE